MIEDPCPLNGTADDVVEIKNPVLLRRNIPDF